MHRCGIQRLSSTVCGVHRDTGQTANTAASQLVQFFLQVWTRVSANLQHRLMQKKKKALTPLSLFQHPLQQYHQPPAAKPHYVTLRHSAMASDHGVWLAISVIDFVWLEKTKLPPKTICLISRQPRVYLRVECQIKTLAFFIFHCFFVILSQFNWPVKRPKFFIDELIFHQTCVDLTRHLVTNPGTVSRSVSRTFHWSLGLWSESRIKLI